MYVVFVYLDLELYDLMDDGLDYDELCDDLNLLLLCWFFDIFCG